MANSKLFYWVEFRVYKYYNKTLSKWMRATDLDGLNEKQ